MLGMASVDLIEALSLFGPGKSTGVTAVSCFALRLVVATFVDGDTNVFNALATSVVCVAGAAFGAVESIADFGCGIAASVCSEATTRFESPA